MRLSEMEPSKSKSICAEHGQKYISSKDTLINMGFEPNRVTKALAATGFHGASKAADWLFNHAGDPNIDKIYDREYYIYGIPTGELAACLEDFWVTSKNKCSWNGVHDHFPHLTLGLPFKMPDAKAEEVIMKLKGALNKFDKSFLNYLKLEKYISQNYLGLFLSDESDRCLKNLVNNLVNIVSNEGVEIEMPDKPIHMSLAHKFHCKDFKKLKTMVETLNVSLPCQWKIEMFSRDPLFASCKVYEAEMYFRPKAPNQLEFQKGDFIFINEEKFKNSADLWIEGTSWLSGLTGQIPSNHLKKTAATAVWTPLKLLKEEGNNVSMTSTFSGFALGIEKNNFLCTAPDLCHGDNQSSIQSGRFNRQIYVMRHGERVDFTFGNWIPYSFNENGKYVRKDLNMPKRLPYRSGGHQAFSHDTPLTNIGSLQAFLTGEAMKENEIKIDHVFVSPSLRCIETAHNVLCGLEIQDLVKINIEPGLFEWMTWYPSGVPDWMTESELVASGFNIEVKYKSIIKKETLEKTKETTEDFYKRGYHVISELISKSEETGGNILLVGHSLTLDVCSRYLLGKEPRSCKEVHRILPYVHYCSLLGMHRSSSKEWSVYKEPGFLSITHGNNLQFDPANLGL